MLVQDLENLDTNEQKNKGKTGRRSRKNKSKKGLPKVDVQDQVPSTINQEYEIFLKVLKERISTICDKLESDEKQSDKVKIMAEHDSQSFDPQAPGYQQLIAQGMKSIANSSYGIRTSSTSCQYNDSEPKSKPILDEVKEGFDEVDDADGTLANRPEGMETVNCDEMGLEHMSEQGLISGQQLCQDYILGSDPGLVDQGSTLEEHTDYQSSGSIVRPFRKVIPSTFYPSPPSGSEVDPGQSWTLVKRKNKRKKRVIISTDEEVNNPSAGQEITDNKALDNNSSQPSDFLDVNFTDYHDDQDANMMMATVEIDENAIGGDPHGQAPSSMISYAPSCSIFHNSQPSDHGAYEPKSILTTDKNTDRQPKRVDFAASKNFLNSSSDDDSKRSQKLESESVAPTSGANMSCSSSLPPSLFSSVDSTKPSEVQPGDNVFDNEAEDSTMLDEALLVADSFMKEFPPDDVISPRSCEPSDDHHLEQGPVEDSSAKRPSKRTLNKRNRKITRFTKR